MFLLLQTRDQCVRPLLNHRPLRNRDFFLRRHHRGGNGIPGRLQVGGCRLISRVESFVEVPEDKACDVLQGADVSHNVARRRLIDVPHCAPDYRSVSETESREVGAIA